MRIVTKTTFICDGQEFRDLPKVADHVNGEIDKILRSENLIASLPPRQRFAIHDCLVNNRERLIALLSCSYVVDDGEFQGPEDVRSIFDI